MMKLLALLSFVATAFAAIGPVADINIANHNLAPDGFTRSFVLLTIIISE